jgi:tRNA uridine 5-carboxymethylaminomethyl modification enzyme
MRQSDKMIKIYSRPGIGLKQMKSIRSVSDFLHKHQINTDVQEQVEVQIKYSGYIEKERQNADKLNRLEAVAIPSSFNYDELASLSHEAKEKLNKIRPKTISQASRISGIKPSDISVLLVCLGR